MQPLTKHAWLAACHFHDLSEQAVLDEVAYRVENAKHPLVLLDLDSTLYEVAPRTHQILQEWLEHPDSHLLDPSVRSELLKIDAKQIGYSIRDTFMAIGLDITQPKVQQAMTALKKFWTSRFFTSEYLQYDLAYPGAVQFTKKLYKLGAEIVYLTGRDEPGMGEGTRKRLVQDGFPWKVAKTHLLLKPTAEMPDIKHKIDARDYVRSHGTLVASFENEPANLSALYKEFPEAMHVFVDTVSSDHEAVPCQGLYRIFGFGGFGVS